MNHYVMNYKDLTCHALESGSNYVNNDLQPTLEERVT